MAALAVPVAQPAQADTVSNSPKYGWREMWSGADATKDVWLLYSGVTLAPLSKDIYSDGLRLRLSGGYGQYTFEACAKSDRACNESDPAKTGKPIEFRASVSYADVLVGYLYRYGALTSKAFVGLSFVEQRILPTNESNLKEGREIGIKGALEFWLNVGEKGWTSLDLSYSTAFDTSAARWRAGYRALRSVSVGPEVRYDRNSDGQSARAGVFARYEWVGGEASVATGVASSFYDGLSRELSPYATVNVLTQF